MRRPFFCYLKRRIRSIHAIMSEAKDFYNAAVFEILRPTVSE